MGNEGLNQEATISPLTLSRYLSSKNTDYAHRSLKWVNIRDNHGDYHQFYDYLSHRFSTGFMDPEIVTELHKLATLLCRNVLQCNGLCNYDCH